MSDNINKLLDMNRSPTKFINFCLVGIVIYCFLSSCAMRSQQVEIGSDEFNNWTQSALTGEAPEDASETAYRKAFNGEEEGLRNLFQMSIIRSRKNGSLEDPAGDVWDRWIYESLLRKQSDSFFETTLSSIAPSERKYLLGSFEVWDENSYLNRKAPRTKKLLVDRSS